VVAAQACWCCCWRRAALPAPGCPLVKLLEVPAEGIAFPAKLAPGEFLFVSFKVARLRRPHPGPFLTSLRGAGLVPARPDAAGTAVGGTGG